MTRHLLDEIEDLLDDGHYCTDQEIIEEIHVLIKEETVKEDEVKTIDWVDAKTLLTPRRNYSKKF